MDQTKQIRYSRDPDIKGIEICYVDESYHVFPTHLHEDIYGISLIESGASYCLGKDRPDLVVHAGELVLLNPAQIHSGVPLGNGPVSYWMMYIDYKTMTALAEKLCSESGTAPEFKTMISTDRKIAQGFVRLMDSFARGAENRLDKEKKQHVLYDFFSQVFARECQYPPRTRPDATGNNTVRLAKTFLSRNLEMSLPLDRLAREVGVSQYHFIRTFKRHTGISPHQFRIHCRVQAAKKLIRENMPFSEIALATGFSDQSHFTNTFRQYTGATPGQYSPRN